MMIRNKTKLSKREAYVSDGCNVFISSVMEMSATTGKRYFLAFDNHPVLVRLLFCKVSVRYVCFPHFISALRPLDRNLDPNQHKEENNQAKVPLQATDDKEARRKQVSTL